MYKHNDYKFGFIVRRDTWGNTLAKIIEIEGVTEGEKIKGRHPYYGNPTVKAQFFKSSNPSECIDSNIDNISVLSCGGNFSYSLVE